MNFKIVPLRKEIFADLFTLSGEQLESRGASRTSVEESHSSPCRISMEDAEPGELLITVSFSHLNQKTPYRAAGPIFIRQGATDHEWEINEVPQCLRRRLVSLRAYDATHTMVDCDMVEGKEIEQLIERFLNRTTVSYIHVHYARPGCYACRIDRANGLLACAPLHR